jgi:Uma2 family endonuclease
MSTESLLAKEAIRREILPLSVEQYHQLCERSAALQKTELIEGLIIAKITKSPLHAYLISLLYEFFSARLPDNYLVRKEDPLTLATSEPEPDIAIIKGALKDFRSTHPTMAELVIEIALSSLELDREKAALYAAAGIPEYWIVIPEADCVEVYQDPARGCYQRLKVYQKAETIPTPWGVLDLQMLFE